MTKRLSNMKMAKPIEETRKKLIFEKYMKTKDMSDKDWKFCEKIDWHPVDELPLKKEFIKKMEKIRKGRYTKFSSIDELRKLTS